MFHHRRPRGVPVIRYVTLIALYLFSSVLFAVETVPATASTVDALKKYAALSDPPSATVAEACDYRLSTYTNTAYVWSRQLNGNACSIYRSGSYWEGVSITERLVCANGTQPSYGKCTVYTCPDSSWTLDGQTCKKNIICQDGYSLDTDGICRKNCTGLQTRVDGEDCACRPNNVFLTNRVGMSVSGNGSIPDTVCYNDCEFKTGEAVGGGGMWFGLLSQPTYKKCNGTAPDADMPPREEPPCKATEGVMTSSSGTVACVPEGTPTARKPQVKESKTKQQFPDGSVKEVKKVDTKDPATGATHSSTTSTSTGGQSGPAGETKETSSSSSSTSGGSGGGGGEGDEPGQCAKEPESPMCKKGEVKKKGEFGDDSMQNDIQDAKDRYKQLINNISGEIGNMFDLSLSGGGSLPCPPPVNVMGASFGICFADYSESLSIIGLGILFIAAILSAFIILRK